MRFRTACLVLASPVTAAPVVATAAACLESCLDTACSAAAARDSVVTFECYPSSTSQGRMVYDLVAGHLYAEARLLVSGGAGGFAATCSASILEQGGASASANDGGAPVLSTVLGIPLTHAPGVEFVIECYAGGSAGGVGSIGFADAVLLFAGLPAGYGVTSCHGFSGDGAVAARSATWGSLKLRYR